MAHNYARKSMLSISGPVGRRKREAFGNIPNVNVNTPYPIGPNSPVPINHIVPNYSIPTNEVFFYCMMCLLRVVVVVVVVVVVCVVDVTVVVVVVVVVVSVKIICLFTLFHLRKEKFVWRRK